MCDSLVVVVGVADLQTVNARLELACVFDADQVAEFVCHHIRKPTVAAADFKVPVGEPEVDGVFARNSVAVTVERVIESRVHSTGQVVVVAVDNGIIDCFGVGGNLGCVGTIFGGVNKVEMVGACGFPVNVTIITIKTVGESYASKQK